MSELADPPQTKLISRPEFIFLMALMTAIVPLAIDGMLPAFARIGDTFNVHSAIEIQLIISFLFLGFGFGQFIFGPLSDVFGRKPPIYWGLAIFIFGTLISGIASSFEVFLLGRFLQGFGGAAPRIVSLALIRDEYSGDSMARITSLVMTIFILVPAIAPSLGQGVLFFANWRAIFILLSLVAILTWVWFANRQHETLPKNKRKKLTLQQIKFGLKETFSQSSTLASMLMSGLIFGILIGYLGAVQNLFATLFNITTRFPIYFGILAISLGVSSFFNSKLVMRLGMRRLILYALIFLAINANAFAFYLIQINTQTPPLWLFMIFMMSAFFSIGFLFGNLNAMAMQPLGHVAGIASSLLGFCQSTIGVVVGLLIGQLFHASVTPLVLSFSSISLICIVVLYFEKKFRSIAQTSPLSK